MPQREDCRRGSVREEQTTVIRGAQSDRVENALITDELLTIAQAADWLGTSADSLVASSPSGGSRSSASVDTSGYRQARWPPTCVRTRSNQLAVDHESR